MHYAPRLMRVARVSAVRAGALLLSLAVAVAFGGCAGTSLLHRPVPRVPKTHVAAIYLSQIDVVQGQLQLAEGRIPRSPHTPRALSRSIRLLASAVRALAAGLAAAHPPAEVKRIHSGLIRTARTYARQLQRSSRLVATSAGELRGAADLTNATSAATASFTTGFAQIRTRLTRPRQR